MIGGSMSFSLLWVWVLVYLVAMWLLRHGR